jgi:hypothetical protein
MVEQFSGSVTTARSAQDSLWGSHLTLEYGDLVAAG